MRQHRRLKSGRNYLGWQIARHQFKFSLAFAAVKPAVPMLLLAPTHREAISFIHNCWVMFLVVWAIAALNAKRTKERWSTAAGLGYLLANVIFWYLLADSDFLGDTLLVHHGPLPSLLAEVVCFVGTVVTVWARVVLGRNWSGSITFKEDHELIERGPYQFVRHPIYTGLLLMALGTALVRGTPDAFLGLLFFIVIHVWKLRSEEALLTRHFPDSYPGYRARTKALIPFVY
jgi:protein-S-isoprenylcysteine O-methyltransferase Ste14